MPALPTHPNDFLREFRASHPYHQLEVDGWSWRYLTAGNGPHTLLLLPGAFVGPEMWLHLITSLKDSYRILAPDMPSKALSLAETNAALVRLLDALELEKVILIGYSAGGGLAQAFVQAHPERVEHLVLSHCSPLSPDAARRIQRLVGLIRLLPLPLIRAIFKKRTRRYPAGSDWADFTRFFFSERIAILEKESLVRFFQSGGEAARAFQFDPLALQNWQGRILLMTSRDDETTFPRLGSLQARHPSAQTHVFEQGGHHTVLLFPELYNSTLAGFLEAAR